MEPKDKIAITKDSIGIIKEVLLIITLGLTIYKGTDLVDKQKELINKRQSVATEELRTQYIGKLDTLNKDIKLLDEKLVKDAPWKGSPTWERLEGVRKLKQEEVKRVETELKSMGKQVK